MENILREEKVIVKYNMNTKNGIKDDKSHPLYGGLSNRSFIGIPAPMNINKVFSKEELAFLSEDLDEDLSVKSSFWKEYRVNEYGGNTGIFPIALYKEGTILNYNNSLDYIRIKCLEASPLVGMNAKDSRDRSCRFTLIKAKDQYKEDITLMTSKKEAMKLYMKYEDDEAVLTYLLKSFGKGLADSHTLEFLQKEAWKVMENNSQIFMRTLADKHLPTKIKLDEFVRYNLIEKSNGLYFNIDGSKIALDNDVNDIEGAAVFFDSGLGKEPRLELEAKLKVLKKK